MNDNRFPIVKSIQGGGGDTYTAGGGVYELLKSVFHTLLFNPRPQEVFLATPGGNRLVIEPLKDQNKDTKEMWMFFFFFLPLIPLPVSSSMFQSVVSCQSQVSFHERPIAV